MCTELKLQFGLAQAGRTIATPLQAAVGSVTRVLDDAPSALSEVDSGRVAARHRAHIVDELAGIHIDGRPGCRKSRETLACK